MDSAGSDADAAADDAVVRQRGDPRFDRIVVLVATAVVVVALDQLTKWWALNALDDQTIDVFWTLRFRLVFNTGAAFSLVDGLGPVLGLGAVIIVAVLLWVGRVSPDRRTAAALGAIAGGALGNLSDRIFRDGDGFLGGAVVDFIDVQFWPVWNVADMAIVIGSVVLVFLASRSS